MTTENQRNDYARKFKPCKLVMFYAHGHRTNDYRITDREAEVHPDGTEVSRWRTTKTIPDPENAKKAASLRAKFIKEVCDLGVQYGQEKLVFVDFEKADDLDDLKRRWKEVNETFNRESPIVKINFGTLPPLDLTGSNEYLLGNLLDEMKGTMAQMKQALEQADYKGIREVVGRLKGFVTLVPDQQANLIVDAIADARKQARSMRAMLEKKGKTLQEVQEMISTSTVDIAVAACLGDETLPTTDGPTANDLMEAQAQEFCAAFMDSGDSDEPGDSEDPGTVLVVDPEPVPTTETMAATPPEQDLRYDF